MFFSATNVTTDLLIAIRPDARIIPEANRATPPAACPSKVRECTRSDGMWMPAITMAKAITGAQTIGCFTVFRSMEPRKA